MVRVVRLLPFAACYLLMLEAALAAIGDLAIQSANQRTAKAERMITRCGERFQGKAVIDCVSLGIGFFTNDVGSCGYIKSVAPRAHAIIQTAAMDIKRATTKEAALSVLNKATGLLRALSAESSADARKVYSRVNRAFETAISVIDSRVLANVSLAPAETSDGAWFGEMNCGKLSFTPGPLKAPVDITVVGTAVTFSREALNQETAAVIGHEEGTGELNANGAVKLTAVWKPTGGSSRYKSTGDYNGLLAGRFGTLQGTQTWIIDGKSETRNCTITVAR
jgi:hypothetical protein